MHSLFPMPGARWRWLATTLAAVTILCGCASSVGSSNGILAKTPAQIVAAAKSAAAGAATVHVAGSILGDGTPISVEMELVSDKGGQGRITLEGFDIQLVNVDNAVYINSGEGFYARFAGAAGARRLRGRWLKGSARGEALGPLDSLTNLGELIGGALRAHGPLSRGTPATVDGQRAVAVTDLDRGGTLYVASTGVPYPLEIVKPGPGGGELVFDRWNQPVSLEPPANAINIKQLQGR
jgi:hypothetical protein